MNTIPFMSKDEELQFFLSVLDTTPALINITQIEDFTDLHKNINLWANRQVYNYTGYNLQEVKELGFAFFSNTMHPDDMALINESVGKLRGSETNIFGGLVRLKSKLGDYKWFIGTMTVLELRNGLPWRIMTFLQNMEDMKDTHNQILQLIKENLQLKNQLVIRSLSPREIQVISLIASGKTDKEIAAHLSISPATVKTHRHNIIQKLNLKNKAHITQFAAETGLI